MKRWALWIVFIASLLGIVLSLLSTSQYFRVRREGFETKSFCAMSETINCDVVAASSYATFAEAPTAWWGFLFYLFVGGVAVVSLLSKASRASWLMLCWLLSVAGLILSAWLAFVSWKVLGAVCLECLGMDVATLAIVVFGFLACGFSRDLLRRLGNPILAFAIVLGLGWVAMQRVQASSWAGGASRATVEEKMRAHYLGSIYPVTVDASWPVWGNPVAQTVIVEFSDFQCPFCRVAAFDLRPYLQEFRNDIQIRFVNYPLDKSCNDKMERELHRESCLAARAVTCAASRDDFWEFHDDVFRHQKDLSRDVMITIAEQRGWTKDEFETCLDASATDERVKAEVKAGNDLYLHETPAILLNGRRIHYWRDSRFLQALVKEEIKKAKKK